jgi:hypothetical protein
LDLGNNIDQSAMNNSLSGDDEDRDFDNDPIDNNWYDYENSREDDNRYCSESITQYRSTMVFKLLLAGPEHTEAFDGFLGKLKYFFLGSNVGEARYDINGNYLSPALVMGEPPTLGYGKGIKIIQYGGHTLNKGTLKALQITKEEGKIAIESMKKANHLPPNFHGNIGKDGSFWTTAGKYIDNILDYIK